MTATEWELLAPMDLDCFACGRDNPYGLRMRFYHRDGVLRSDLEVPKYLCGWNTLVHGGILSTILDEVMSWTAIHLLSPYILTRDMSVRYRRPVYVQTPLTVYGWIKESGRGRKAVVAADPGRGGPGLHLGGRDLRPVHRGAVRAAGAVRPPLISVLLDGYVETGSFQGKTRKNVARKEEGSRPANHANKHE